MVERGARSRETNRRRTPRIRNKSGKVRTQGVMWVQ